MVIKVDKVIPAVGYECCNHGAPEMGSHVWLGVEAEAETGMR